MNECSTMNAPVDHQALRDRLGVHRYRQRMNIQNFHATQAIGQGRTWFHPENLPSLSLIINITLRCLGLYWWGKRNARNIQVRENQVALHRLPDAFQGYRLLHLSDFHLDIDPGITDVLIEKLKGIQYDACVMTGDFRAATSGPAEPALAEMTRIMPHLKQPIFGILGNHDFLEFTPVLEAMGIRMLLNENAALERDNEKIYIAGIDDPHFYETDNFEKAIQGIPAEATKILLSHSAEPIHQALGCGFDLMLSGHTHGGQLCLPGGIAVMNNANQSRSMLSGPWRFHDVQGYTSTGVGCSMVPIRFFCPPEITIHTLTRAPRK
jgi:predicted MPP superfamily phosphohydrolase